MVEGPPEIAGALEDGRRDYHREGGASGAVALEDAGAAQLAGRVEGVEGDRVGGVVEALQEERAVAASTVGSPSYWGKAAGLAGDRLRCPEGVDAAKQCAPDTVVRLERTLDDSPGADARAAASSRAARG